MNLPVAPVSAGSTLYFLAREQSTGSELWLTDGTQGGTRLVAEFINGLNYGGITGLAALGNTVFLSTAPSVSDGALFRTEGAPGTTVPFDRSLSRWTNPGNLITCNGALFFQDYNPASISWKGLWKSDGTLAGTVQLSQEAWFRDYFDSSRFVCANGTLFFVASKGPGGEELWTSDGTAGGTRLLANLGWLPAPLDGAPFIFAAGSHAFVINSFSGGIWASDGTPGGTVLLKGGDTEDSLFNAESFTPVGETLYFVARDPQNRQGLWTSDGTAEGTRMIAELPWDGPRPALVSLGDTLLFSVGHTLYRSNGTPEGTVRLESPGLTLDAREGAALLPDGRWLVLASTDLFSEPYSLWVTDGTSAGTARLQPASGQSFRHIRDLVHHGSQALFWADDFHHGMEPWVTDGTPAGTRMLRDIFRDDSSHPASLVDVDGTLFFTAFASGHGRELWKSDGTAEGTMLVKDINPVVSNYGPTRLTRVGQTLFFFTHTQVWRSDGTEAGTFPVLTKQNTGIGTLTGSLGSTFFFSEFTSESGLELWKSDGTPEGTVLFKDINPGPRSGAGNGRMVQVGSTLFFTGDDGIHGQELWKTDGTPEGTVLVKDIRPGSNSSSIFSPLVNAGGTLFFVAHDGVHGQELWKSDGTAEGTQLVKDIHTNAGYPIRLVARGGTVFFIANDGVHGQELWKSDGTAEGTQLVKDIAPGLATGIPLNHEATLRVIDGTLYFAADDGVHGMELWKSDGTAEGTTLLRELTPGAAGSALQNLVPIGNHGTFAFAVPDATGNLELWRSDGTTEGTWPLYDIAPGWRGSSPFELTVSGSRLFFVADEGGHGRELWSVKHAAFHHQP